MGGDFRSGGSLVALPIDRAAHDLAQALVRDAEDGALPHCWVAVERRLHLRAVDVFTATNDKVLEAVQDVDHAALYFGDVAGVKEALLVDCFRRVLRPVVVAPHVHGGPDAKLTTLSVLDPLFRVRILHLDFHEQRDGLAATGGMLHVVHALVEADHVGLGKTVALRGTGLARLLVHLRHLRRRHRGATCGHVLDGLDGLR
mmetsp:Transcript_41734/g.88933  ORF Transcript_41734/g.88933 Transcript_41734/m.88933 type:complete len:201 (-) Transcript_41734:1072-1674(-)